MTRQSSLKVFWIICFVVTAVSLFILVELNTEQTNFAHLLQTRIDKSTTSVKLPSGFLVNTNGCRIPNLDPFDPSIQQFIFDEKDTKCAKIYGMALVESNLTSLFINESALAYYNITDLNDLRCCYTPFWREELEKNLSGIYPRNVDAQIRFADTCTKFTTQATVTDEFVKVQCSIYSNFTKNYNYTDYHAFTPMKTFVKKDVVNNSLNKSSVSVLILGLDSVSRLNFHRQMPLTAKFIESQLHGVELSGYNKVADNTFPNVIPVLTGHSVEELVTTCWPSRQSVFDDCNFIWDQFRAVGHITSFSEDAPSADGIFTYLNRGFRKQPTDYYIRPFNSQTETNIAFDQRMLSKLCVGPRSCLQILLNNIFKFEITMKSELSFSFAWSMCMSHDFFNLPKLADADVKDFLESLYGNGIFEKTILVFMSDHGMRWGGFRETYQGRYEERLPLLYIAYPDWFRQKFTTAISNLKSNARKLTSPFDLHETLLDFTNLVRLEEKILKIRSQDLSEMKNVSRGISLFLPIPESRTCKDAGIVDHWCTCHQSVSVSTNDAVVKTAADFLVVHINSLIIKYPRCARLQLQNITNARAEKATSHKTFETSDGGFTDVSVTIKTVPGDALFESTVRCNLNTKNFTIIGTVSRINLYGNQSSCISHARHRLYCYCI